MATYNSRTSVSTNTYTFPVQNKAVKCNWMRIYYTSSATVGNRQVRTEIYDGANLVWSCSAGAVQAASLSRTYAWMPGIYRETAFIDGGIQVPFPADMTLLPGMKLKVYDSANISATDTMVIDIQHRDHGQHD